VLACKFKHAVVDWLSEKQAIGGRVGMKRFWTSVSENFVICIGTWFPVPI